MNKITIKVNDHEYNIICPNEETKKLNCLADLFNQRLKQLNIDFKKFSQAHAFLTLGLMLLDEINELKNTQTNINTEHNIPITNDNQMENINEFLNNITYCIDKIEKSLNKLESHYNTKIENNN